MKPDFLADVCGLLIALVCLTFLATLIVNWSM